jgi:hypothetical protein
VSHRKTRTRDVNNEDDRVHELVDIIAEEVSDVDRAANRRRYLAIKRENDSDEDGLGPELFDDEDMDSDPEDASLAKARRSRADEDDEESEDEELADVFEGDEASEDEEESDEEDEDDEEAEEDGAEDDEGRRKPRRGKARKEAQTLSANTKAALLRRTAPVLERMTKLVASIQRAAETQERGAQATPEWVTRELQWICNALEQLIGQSSKSATKPVNKLGAKMASQRREQLKGAVELLQRLLQEVMPELAASRAPGPNQPQPTAKAARREPDAHGEFGALLASMTEGISALTTQVKTQAAELARLKKSTGLPASRPVESVRRPAPPAPEEDWPFDMNAPLSRDRVAKEISFFDE